VTAHARVSPSALYRIGLCPASLTMQEAFPHLPWEDEEASAEGTCAHWVLATVLTGGPWPAVGTFDPAGTPTTEEMIDAVELAVDAVDAMLAAEGCSRADLVVEQPVACKRIHESCWGTPDLRFWSRVRPMLFVLDFKFGLRYVDEFENEQLVAYTIGALDEKPDLDDRAVDCANVILQPRAYGKAPVRTWTYRASEIRAFVNVLANRVLEALAPNPPARAAPEACRDCRARHGCPTNQRAGQEIMAYAGQPMPMELPPAALSTELRFATRALKLLKARVDGLTAQAEYLAAQGARLPHHTLKPGRGSTTWNVPDDQVIAIGKIVGLDLAKPPAAVTPLQAVKAGLHDALLASLATKRPGALTLVEDDGSTARRVFGGNKETTQ
jgi:hypothetical protein